MYSIAQSKIIEHYIDTINDIIAEGILNNNKQNDVHISLDNKLSEIKNINEFTIAIFVLRNAYHMNMYQNKHNVINSTYLFKILNYLFFKSINIKQKSSDKIFLLDNKDILKQIILLAQKDVNKIYGNKFVTNYAEEYYEKIKNVSTCKGDMHSYCISQKEIKLYLEEKKLTIEDLKKVANKILKAKGFISKCDLENNLSWQYIQKKSLSDPKDDTLIIKNIDIENSTEEIKKFISIFEAHNCKKCTDIENELIFAYKCDRYLYISRFCMEITQELIENFFIYGQYENLFTYYFQSKRDEKLLLKYNKLMTYKIADVLLTNKYILPKEKMKIRGNSTYVPRIEIKNYVNKLV